MHRTTGIHQNETKLKLLKYCYFIEKSKHILEQVMLYEIWSLSQCINNNILVY